MRCLNTQKCKTYQDKKQDPEFLYKRARKEILRQIKKTGKMPKQSTIEKYDIRDEEIKECMGRKGIIYKITSPSGKVYIGQTMRSFEERIRQHKRRSSNCTLLKNAIQKYGDQMKYEIIEEDILREQLDKREVHWISHFNSLAPDGYNLDSGGNSNKEFTEELKNRVRDGMNKSKIEKDGYLGCAPCFDGLFRPLVTVKGKDVHLSTGGFQTKEEAVEVLKEYTKDPENFKKVQNSCKSKIGCVYRKKNRWCLSYKKKYIGTYATEEEAEEARKALQSSTYTSSSEIG
jgi:group I intron endonuclease